MSNFSQFLGGGGVVASSRDLRDEGYIRHPQLSNTPKNDIFFYKEGVLPTLAPFPQGASDGDKIFLYGGRGYNDMYMFDTNTGIWQKKASGGIAQRHIAVAYDNDNIYLIGGYLSSYRNEVFKYNIALDTYIQLASLPVPLGYATAQTYNGKIYCVGGYGSSSLYIYDIALNAWTTGANALSAHDGTSVLKGDKFYLIGGTGATNKIQVYDIASNTWSTLDMPFSATSQSAILHENSLFIKSTTNDIWLYDFIEFKQIIKFPHQTSLGFFAVVGNDWHMLGVGDSGVNEHWVGDISLLKDESENNLKFFMKRI